MSSERDNEMHENMCQSMIDKDRLILTVNIETKEQAEEDGK